MPKSSVKLNGGHPQRRR